ncbi:hypothetical protein KC842_02395 [Candidatus Nomurabacteria bacterium]|nr:hypothetical protein [Candidatus Nomurabacteria bacterium]
MTTTTKTGKNPLQEELRGIIESLYTEIQETGTGPERFWGNLSTINTLKGDEFDTLLSFSPAKNPRLHVSYGKKKSGGYVFEKIHVEGEINNTYHWITIEFKDEILQSGKIRGVDLHYFRYKAKKDILDLFRDQLQSIAKGEVANT